MTVRFRTEVLWTLAIQGGGAIAAFVAIAWLGATLGPSSQGVFSRTKVEVEFVAAAAALGLPQALFFYLRNRQLSVQRATAISSIGASVCIPIGVLYGGWFAHWSALEVALLVSAAYFSVLHANLRAVTLAAASAQTFNFVTAAPQLLTLAYIAVAIAIGRVQSADASGALGLCFAIGVALALVAIVKSAPWKAGEAQSTVGSARLVKYGLATWLSSVFFTASTLMCMRSAESDLDSTSVGVFSMALALAQALITPLNYSLPLLFKRWTTAGARVLPLKVGVVVSAMPLIAAGVSYLLYRFNPDSLILGAYSPALAILWIMLVAVSAEGLFRIVSVAVNASGNPRLAVLADALRGLTVASALSIRKPETLHDVAIAWMIGCIVAAACLVALWTMAVRNRGTMGINEDAGS